MKLMIVFLLIALATPIKADAQVTNNVFNRVLKIRVNSGTPHEESATAFTIDVDGREYLVTAKHVVEGLKESDTVDIFIDSKWSTLSVKIFLCADPIDIAVLIPPRVLTGSLELPYDQQHLEFGQETYFLGFPYGFQTAVAGAYGLALAKRGTFSGVVTLDAEKKAFLLLLDGYNNPGFSGGPIVYRDSNLSGYVLKLAGVVSGFIPDVVPTMKEHDIDSPALAGEAAKMQPWKIQKRRNGTYFEYVESGTFVALNTGIVRGFTIEPAIALIHQHSIGPEVKQQR